MVRDQLPLSKVGTKPRGQLYKQTMRKTYFRRAETFRTRLAFDQFERQILSFVVVEKKMYVTLEKVATLATFYPCRYFKV